MFTDELRTSSRLLQGTMHKNQVGGLNRLPHSLILDAIVISKMLSKILWETRG